MPYQYTAYTQAGAVISGMADGPSQSAVEDMLWRRNYFIAGIKHVPPAKSWREQFPSLFGVKTRDVIIFTKQLATLIQSGIPLVRALVVLREQVSNVLFGQCLDEVVHLVETGTPVSAALAKFPQVFPVMYCRMVEVGERTGHLDQVLEQTAIYMEKREGVLRKVKGAMSYPLFVLALAGGVIMLLVNTVLPSLMGLFSEFNAELPITTQALLGFSSFMQAYGTVVLAVIVLAVIAIMAYGQRPQGRRLYGAVLLKLPVLGPIAATSTVAMASRSMAVLLKAGVPLADVMELTSGAIDNPVVVEAFERVKAGLFQGQGLAEPLEQEPVFPRLFSSMVKVGEESGSLDAILVTLADFYEEEADRAINRLTGMIEPTLTIVVGGIIAFIAASVFTPLYSIMGNIG